MNKRKITRIISLSLIVLMLSSVNTFALSKENFVSGLRYVSSTITGIVKNTLARLELSDGLKNIFDDIENAFDSYCDEEDITIGNVERKLESEYDFVDIKHVISHQGEPVTLECPKEIDQSKVKYYQWYSCSNRLRKNPHKIGGAIHSTYTTEPIKDIGIKYYFLRVILKKGCKYSSMRTGVFMVANTGLPTVEITTPEGKHITSKQNYLEDSNISIYSAEEEERLKLKKLKIKGRGNSSWDVSSKNGYTLKLEKKENLFGFGKNKTWVLIGNYADKSLLRNRLANELNSAFSASTSYVNKSVTVDLVLNGEYRGTYDLSTSIRLGENRIDIKDISEATDDSQYTSCGFIVERDNADDDLTFNTNKGYRMVLKDPDFDGIITDENSDIINYIEDTVNKYEDILYSDEFTDTEDGYTKYFDVDSFVDWYLLEELMKNLDGQFNRSTYIYYDPADSKLHMGPVWDNDMAFGNRKGEVLNTEGLYCRSGWVGRMFEDPAFEQRVKDRWAEKKDAIQEIVNTWIQSEGDKIKVSAKMNFARWGMLNIPFHEYKPYSKFTGTYQGEINYLINWTNKRIEWLDSQFD